MFWEKSFIVLVKQIIASYFSGEAIYSYSGSGRANSF
jgi:hypothetical protein